MRKTRTAIVALALALAMSALGIAGVFYHGAQHRSAPVAVFYHG